ncbi:AMP-binding protein [Cumulibacter manganitolerans]|uniref:AMP-binding protein n=1 Tax=Cumulibacter manganitolerans TaxID=1884992 RepID=UPI00129501C5|nr:AMP-binding protein [Cumulibacter manganitolerans]
MARLPNFDDRTLSFAFERVLNDRPDAVAFIDNNRQLTFEHSYRLSLQFSGGLANLGVGRAEPVALLLDNSLDMQHAWSGIGLGGGIEVPINTAHRGHFLTHMLNDSSARTLVVEDAYVDRLTLIAEELQSLQTLVVRGDVRAADELRGRYRVIPLEEVQSAAPISPRPNDPSELIAYMYTSGTTGPSKGVEISHVHAYTYSSREDGPYAPTPADRVLVTLPMFHLAGQWVGCYGSVIHQNSCVIETGFSASRFWPTVRRHGVTYTTLLGAMAEILQQQPRQDDDADNPLVYATMHPLATDVYGFAERFDIEIGTGYGMSEIGAVMSNTWATLVPGEAGLGREGYELKVMRADGSPASVGEVGELWVRPEDPRMVMRAYHGLPEKTAETIVDGWVHTGDAFKVDADGHFFFIDRMKDALRRRGENISSFEVEKAINEHPQVYESAVVGVPSELSEDDIKAVVVPRPGEVIDFRELTEFLAQRMPYFMVPRYFQTTTDLPRTPTLKVQKQVLRDAGSTADVWDREAAGVRVTKDGRVA